MSDTVPAPCAGEAVCHLFTSQAPARGKRYDAALLACRIMHAESRPGILWPGILWPSIWTALAIILGLGIVTWRDPEATSGPWTSAIFGAAIVLTAVMTVLLAVGYSTRRWRLLEPIPALATLPIVLMLGQTMRLSSTLNDYGDPTFHLRATLRWAALPLAWQANPFSQGFATTYPWYWHLLDSIVVRLLTLFGLDPERAFVLSIGAWAFALPLVAYLLIRWVTRSPLAVTASVATLALVATIDVYKSWTFVLATVLALLAARVWLAVGDGTTSRRTSLAWSAVIGAGTGILFGWYTSAALVAGLAIGGMALGIGWASPGRIGLRQRSEIIAATGVGFLLAAAPFWLSTRSAVAAAAGGAAVDLKIYEEIPYALSFHEPLWLLAVIVPGLVTTTALLFTRDRPVALGLLAIAGAGVGYAAIDLWLTAELFHARVAIIPSFALFLGLLWGAPQLVEFVAGRLQQPTSAVIAGTIALLLIPVQVVGYAQVLGTVREGGHREWIEKTFLTQPNMAIRQIAEASGTALLAVPAPQVAASDSVDLWKLVIGSDWSVLQDRVDAVPDTKPSSRLIAQCTDLHDALTNGFSSPIDLALIAPEPGGLMNLTLRQVTPAFVAGGDVNGEVRDLRLEFPASALCPERFDLGKAAGLITAKPRA